MLASDLLNLLVVSLELDLQIVQLESSHLVGVAVVPLEFHCELLKLLLVMGVLSLEDSLQFVFELFGVDSQMLLPLQLSLLQLVLNLLQGEVGTLRGYGLALQLLLDFEIFVAEIDVLLVQNVDPECNGSIL